MGYSTNKIHNANRYWFNMSARRIPKNYRNVTGIAAHKKSTDVAAFESTLERDFLTLIEFSPEVESFEVQPVTIEWPDPQGKNRRYTPDVLVHYTKKSKRIPTLFEVKYRSDMAKAWNDLKPKFKKALSFAKTQGWRFKLLPKLKSEHPSWIQPVSYCRLHAKDRAQRRIWSYWTRSYTNLAKPHHAIW